MNSFWSFITRALPIWAKWLVLTGSFFFLELIHASWVVFWFGFGAFAAALVAFFFPHAIPYQVAVFFAVSILLVIFARRIIVPIVHPPSEIYPRPSHGKEVLCVEEINNHNSTGAVQLWGRPYNAKSYDDVVIKAGQRVKVVGEEGNTIIVSPLRSERK